MISKRAEKIFVLVTLLALVTLVSFVLTSGNISDTLMGSLLDSFTEPEWGDINPRDMVKNSIPITLLDKQSDGKCLTRAEGFDLIINHRYFEKGDELAKSLSYDIEDKTILLPCSLMQNGTHYKLSVWYIVPDAEKNAAEYRYFVTVAGNSTIQN